MEPGMRVSGTTKDRRMVVVSKSGLMAQFMKGTGIRTRLMVEADLYTLMEMSTRESGLKTKPMATDTTIMWMELNTRESGVMISNMAKAKRSGLIMPSILESMLMARRKGLELSIGLMAPRTQVTL